MHRMLLQSLVSSLIPQCQLHVIYDARISFHNLFIIILAREYSISSGYGYSRLIVILPCGSAAIKRTFLPDCARPIPKFTHDTVSRTPPFWFDTAITLHIIMSSLFVPIIIHPYFQYF